MISLLFVFGALAEFAFVLTVHQKHEWKKAATNSVGDKVWLHENEPEKTAVCFKPTRTITTNEVNKPDLDVRGVGETHQKQIGEYKFRTLYGLPLTTKIDISAFFIFNFSYLFFNCIYWIQLR